MSSLRIALLVWLLPSSVLAQEVTTLVRGDATNPTEQPREPVQAASVARAPPLVAEPPAEPEADDDASGGWAALGAELGVGITAATFAGISVIAGDAEIMGPSVFPAIVLASAGGFALAALAEEGDWNGTVGWTLASLFPGAAYGFLAGALAMMLSDELQGSSELTLTIASAAGATIAAPIFAALGDTGKAGVCLVALWGGMLAGALSALPLAVAFDAPGALLVGALTAGAVDLALCAILPQFT
jgi:hypothetical protein